ncbi:hypothetical protein RFI_34704 [Reticulomyxa filosa]|uniref:Uncharacterized protein n=1 Tax=Reticulomyxa filosa TaxID=46433 RepID=X6LPP4_RETFI|nr:hypothetical protein RFI_34704 [Reticulomyxa filosa]|eukprot:ETO02710.1 hypothetical protein RFI_34704 [Reticulomyxa filosa]
METLEVKKKDNLYFHFFYDKKKVTTSESIDVLHIHLQRYSYSLNSNHIYLFIWNVDMYNCSLIDKVKCNGGMQNISNHEIAKEGDKKYAKEIKTLIRLFGDSVNKEELQQKIVYYNGNIEMMIKDLVQQFVEKESKLETESKTNELENTEQKQNQEKTVNEINDNSKNIQKEMEKTEIGEIKPGINLQGYCINQTCLAAKVKLPVWVNIGFDNITFVSDNASFSCPDCKKSTVTSIIKAMFYNAEHSIYASGDPMPVNDNNYQCSYAIKPGLSYELKANKIRQHAKNIEDLRERSERAMNDVEIRNLVTELQKYEITVVKPPNY